MELMRLLATPPKYQMVGGEVEVIEQSVYPAMEEEAVVQGEKCITHLSPIFKLTQLFLTLPLGNLV